MPMKNNSSSGPDHRKGCFCCTSRRSVMAAGAAFVATGLAKGAKAQGVSAPTGPKRIINVHHHILPPKYVTVARDRLLSFAPNFAGVLQWTRHDP